MSNLQYIGARYVTKFHENSSNPDSCNWESGISYEPLTVVTYNDDSYTSKKLVPSNIGNPASNPAYWVKTGDFNASLVALQNAVSNIDNVELPTIRNDISSINDSELPAIRNEISDIISTRDHDNIICVGDSYIANDAPNSWAAQLQNYRPNATIHYRGVGNGGFIGITTTTFLDVLTNIVSNLTPAQKNEVTDVIVLGGLNDASALQQGTATVSDITAAITTFVNYAIANLPNAKVHLGFCGWMAHAYTYRNTLIPYQKQIVSTYRGIRNHSSGKTSYINDIEYFMPSRLSNSTYYQPDNIHPTTRTSEQIAASLNQYLNTGVAGFGITTVDIGLVKKGAITSFSRNWSFTIDRNLLNLSRGVLTLNYNSENIAANTPIDIFEIPYDPVQACSTVPIWLFGVAAVIASDNTFRIVPCELMIANGNVQMNLRISSGAGLTNVNQILIDLPSYTTDVLLGC